MAKRTRKKKRTKSQEEKRTRLLEHLLNKWVCVKQHDDEEESYLFLLHKSCEDQSTSKIEQVILCNDDLYDGVYLFTDFDIDLVYDSKSRKEMIELRPKKYDQKVGKYAEDVVTESYEDLKNYLIGAKYLTEEEFMIYCQSSKKPPGISEILLTFGEVNKDKESEI